MAGALSGSPSMTPLVIPNPATTNLPYQAVPRIAPSTFVAPQSIIAGDVIIDRDAFIGFDTIVRGDWGPVYIGPLCNLHDRVTVHEQPDALIKVGAFMYAVHLDQAVSVLHGSAVHGPCRVGSNTFIGQMVNIFDAEIGANCVILHGAILTGGVKVPDGRLVKPGQVIDRQEVADALPPVTGEWVSLNPSVVKGYYELGRGYGSMLWGNAPT